MTFILTFTIDWVSGWVCVFIYILYCKERKLYKSDDILEADWFFCLQSMISFSFRRNNAEDCRPSSPRYGFILRKFSFLGRILYLCVYQTCVWKSFSLEVQLLWNMLWRKDGYFLFFRGNTRLHLNGSLYIGPWFHVELLSHFWQRLCGYPVYTVWFGFCAFWYMC